MDSTPRGGVYFSDEKNFFNLKEDNLLNDDVEIYVLDTKDSL